MRIVEQRIMDVKGSLVNVLVEDPGDTSNHYFVTYTWRSGKVLNGSLIKGQFDNGKRNHLYLRRLALKLLGK